MNCLREPTAQLGRHRCCLRNDLLGSQISWMYNVYDMCNRHVVEITFNGWAQRTLIQPQFMLGIYPAP